MHRVLLARVGVGANSHDQSYILLHLPVLLASLNT